MPRYRVVIIPAGYKADLKGLHPVEAYRAKYYPQEWAVLDNDWRVWSAEREEWHHPVFPWVIKGNFDVCSRWIAAHCGDERARE